MASGATRVTIAVARVEDAPLVHRVTQEAFAEYLGVLDPPSGVHDETVRDVELAIRLGGALLAWVDEILAGAARYEVRLEYLYVGRVAVHPAHRRRGIASALMARLLTLAQSRGLPEVRLGARASLPSNLLLYQKLDFEIVSVEPHPRGPDQTIWLARRVQQEPRGLE